MPGLFFSFRSFIAKLHDRWNRLAWKSEVSTYSDKELLFIHILYLYSFCIIYDINITFHILTLEITFISLHILAHWRGTIVIGYCDKPLFIRFDGNVSQMRWLRQYLWENCAFISELFSCITSKLLTNIYDKIDRMTRQFYHVSFSR